MKGTNSSFFIGLSLHFSISNIGIYMYLLFLYFCNHMCRDSKATFSNVRVWNKIFLPVVLSEQLPKAFHRPPFLFHSLLCPTAPRSGRNYLLDHRTRKKKNGEQCQYSEKLNDEITDWCTVDHNRDSDSTGQRS